MNMQQLDEMHSDLDGINQKWMQHIAAMRAHMGVIDAALVRAGQNQAGGLSSEALKACATVCDELDRLADVGRGLSAAATGRVEDALAFGRACTVRSNLKAISGNPTSIEDANREREQFERMVEQAVLTLDAYKELVP